MSVAEHRNSDLQVKREAVQKAQLAFSSLYVA
jgi:hypothetical protein